MKKHIFLIVFGAMLLARPLLAQVPLIQNVSPLSTFSNDTLVITGSGFNATPSNLEVWFGGVKGQIITSTDFAIEVKVPAQASHAFIEVINLLARTSGKSPLKFLPSLKTEPFSAANFAAPVEFEESQELWDLCSCDFNTDGKPDIAATKFARPASPYLASQDILLLQNTSTPGNIAFNKITSATVPAINLSYATDNVICGDLNGDGKPELVASRGSDPRNSIVIFRNTSGSNISFSTPTAISKTILFLDNNHSATRMRLHDLNRDGKPEIIVTASTTDFFYVFVNQSSSGTLDFNPTPIKVDINPSGTTLRTYEPEVADFNNDGLPDVIINRFQDNNFYILKNQSTSSISFATPVEVATPTEDFNRMLTADINKDGKLDLILTNSTLISQVSAIFYNESSGGNITFSPDASAKKFNTAVGAWGIDVADMDGDHNPDMIIAPKDVNEINVFLHDGNTSNPGFTRVNIPTSLPTTRNPRNIKVSDMDGDGKPDIVFIGQTDIAGKSAVQILRNTHCHQPEILNERPMTICNGQSIVLKTIQANNVTYSWTKDGSPIGSNLPFLTITTGGVYRVTATNGLCSLFDQLTVAQDASTIPADPIITANTPLCVGSTLTLSSSTLAGGTYHWTTPSGTSLTGQNQTFPVALTDAGEYSLQVTVGVCKSSVVTKRIDVANLASFAIATNPSGAKVCQGANVQLSVSNLANHTYQWKKDGVNITSGGNNNTFTATADGNYTVRITNTALSCGTETAAQQVIVLTPPTAGYNVKATACIGEQITFTSTSAIDARATAVYAWSFGDASSSTVQNPTKAYNTAQPFNTSLTVSYSGVTGCSDNEIVQIAIVNATQPQISAAATSLCPEEQTQLSLSNTFSSIVWNNNNTATGPTFTITGPGTYTVATTDANGCASSGQIVITAKPIVQLQILPAEGERTIAAGESVQLTASGADTYAWSPAETLDNTTIANPVATPAQTIVYTVTGTREGNCTASAEIEIIVDGVLGFPAAFSPNSDGYADVWNIRAQENPDCTLSIFDGRGRRVFEAKGENWDGTSQGKAVPVGTYFYVYGCPGTKPITGTVLVMK